MISVIISSVCPLNITCYQYIINVSKVTMPYFKQAVLKCI